MSAFFEQQLSVTLTSAGASDAFSVCRTTLCLSFGLGNFGLSFTSGSCSTGIVCYFAIPAAVKNSSKLSNPTRMQSPSKRQENFAQQVTCHSLHVSLEEVFMNFHENASPRPLAVAGRPAGTWDLAGDKLSWPVDIRCSIQPC